MKTPYEFHKEVFGVDPVVIGLNWNDVHERISDAIMNGTPYDETKELTPQELAAFEAGDLIF